MKKLIVGLLAAVVLTLSGCGNDITFDNVTYNTFGIVNEATERSPNVIYEVSGDSVIIAILFCETLIIPIYIVGWDLYQPVRLK